MTLKALLVEDSPTQCEFYKSVLEEAGLDVETTHSGQIALEIAFNERPDLIILDINLPGLDGIQVCARLNRSPETADIPVIMLTQRDKPEDAVKGLKAGAIDYIAKDEFATEILLESLQQLGMSA